MINYKIPEGFVDHGFLCLTCACNLRCKYCFVKQHPDSMSLETAIDAIEFINRFKTPGTTAHYQLFGGEPMLMWDKLIVPMVEYIKEKKYDIRFGITTNCTLVDEERLKYMHENSISILTSFDGPETVQNFQRPCADGSSSFDKAMKIIPSILKLDPEMTMRATMLPESVKYLSDVIEFAQSIGYRHIFTMPDEFMPLTEEQLSTLEEGIFKYMMYYIECCSKSEWVDGFIHLANFEEELKNSYILTKWDKPMLGKPVCGLGFHNLSINWNGDLIACQQVSSCEGDNAYNIGNIYLGVDPDKLRKLQESFVGREVHGQDEKMCKSCIRRSACNGGNFCHCNSSFNGDIKVKGKTRCQYDTLLLKYALIARGVLSQMPESIFCKFIEPGIKKELKIE